MRVANIVNMGFESRQTLQKFSASFKEAASINFPQAEILMFVETDDQNGLGKSIYPSEEAREAVNSKEIRTQKAPKWHLWCGGSSDLKVT